MDSLTENPEANGFNKAFSHGDQHPRVHTKRGRPRGRTMGYFPATTEKSCQIYCEIKLVFFYKGAAILKQCILQGRWGRTFKDHNCYVQRSKYESAGGSNHWTIRLALHSSAFYPCGQLEPGFVQSGQPHATGHAKKLRLTTAGARALFFQVWDTL